MKIINGFPAGGTADATSRRIGDKLAGTAYARHGAVVENKTGAAGRIAIEYRPRFDAHQQIVERAGAREFLVEIGGELRARGQWLIGVENPAQPGKLLGTVKLADRALATSGHYRARKLLEGRTATHLISPRTGQPIEAGIELSAVMAESCAEADAWSTAMILLSPDVAASTAQKEGLRVLLLDRQAGTLPGSTIPVEPR